MTPHIYCYLRVSTGKQDLQANKAELLLKVNELNLNSQNVIWIEETISGMKNYKSRELGKIEFKEDDVFIATEMSRIGRTITQIMAFISDLLQKKVKVYFSKSKFEINNSISSQAMIFAFSLASQIERELISIRTKDALQKKKKDGIILGRPKNKMVLDNKASEIKKLLDDGVKIHKIAEKYNMSRATISKLIKKNGYKEKKQPQV